MITLQEIDDADPALAHSPMVQGLEQTFAWIGEHGGIPLTPSKAFRRAFVHWAATGKPSDAFGKVRNGDAAGECASFDHAAQGQHLVAARHARGFDLFQKAFMCGPGGMRIACQVAHIVNEAQPACVTSPTRIEPRVLNL